MALPSGGIVSEPKFVLCEECRKHGRIVLANGFVGPEFCTEETGLRLVSTGLVFERFSETEARSLTAAIAESGLPKRVEDAEIRLSWNVERWNHVRAANPNSTFEPGDVHWFIAQEVSETDIPPGFLDALRRQLSTGTN